MFVLLGVRVLFAVVSVHCCNIDCGFLVDVMLLLAGDSVRFRLVIFDALVFVIGCLLAIWVLWVCLALDLLWYCEWLLLAARFAPRTVCLSRLRFVIVLGGCCGDDDYCGWVDCISFSLCGGFCGLFRVLGNDCVVLVYVLR